MPDYRFDDNDTLALTVRDLDHLHAVRMRKHRPLQWRVVVDTDYSTPRHAEAIRLELIETAGSFIPIEGTDAALLPEPTVKRSQGGRQPVVIFGAKYSIHKYEKERALQAGVNIESAKSLANDRAAEESLETIAATGITPYPNVRLGRGILANTDVSPDTTSVTSPFDDDSDPTVMVNALTRVGSNIYINSKQTTRADTLILPPTLYELCMRKEMDKSHKTVLEVVRQRGTYARILAWHKCAGAGQSSADRVVAGAFMDPLGPIMMMTHEVEDGPPMRQHFSLEIPQTFGTAGVKVEDPSTLGYLDIPTS